MPEPQTAAGARPYLSVIVVSRNDDRSQRMLRRTTLCLTGLIEQMERHGVPSELILVEWIPPAGRPLLRDLLPWPKHLRHCQVKVIVVPASKLNGYAWSEDYSIRDLTPWNVGIRRASGEFVLSTVTDAILSDELSHHFAEQRLDPDALYRIDRCDVDRRVVDLETLDAQLAYCRTHILDVHVLNPLKALLRRTLPVVHDSAPGDFILMSKALWSRVHGFPQGVAPGGDNLVLIMAVVAGARHTVLKRPMRFYHIDHDSIWKNPTEERVRRWLNKCRVPYVLIDVAAWIAAVTSTAKSELERKNLRGHDRLGLRAVMEEMAQGRRSYVYNDDAWGLGGTELPVDHVAGPSLG